jgi:hypothetical protein
MVSPLPNRLSTRTSTLVVDAEMRKRISVLIRALLKTLQKGGPCGCKEFTSEVSAMQRVH